MELHQILIRPQDHTVILLIQDLGGRKETLILDSTGNAKVDAVVAEFQQKVPPDTENPAKAEIQQEIAHLEARLTELKQSIGIAVP